ncbi:MAG: hypothetical protein MRY79_00430 [Alphaproteobacteria bacterium]|nr:hypothetical protein [Alphaproteobacteria bacterium]
MESNTKDVFFNYNGSGTLAGVLESCGIYRPSSIKNLLKLDYALENPQTKDKEVSLYISMDTQDGDKIKFWVIEYRNIHDPNFDLNADANQLAEFEISLPRVTGSKNWQFYLDSKSQHVYVKTPQEAFNVWTTQENFHCALADKLKEALQKHGLVQCPDLSSNYMEARLIGLFLEYRTLARNPHLLAQKLGL